MVAGYLFSRSGLLPPAATRAMSSVTMNFSLPALVFASIVPAFTSENISALGPLSVLAFIYVVIGLVFGLVIREVCHVPRNFWQGIVVATAMSNWGNLRENLVVLWKTSLICWLFSDGRSDFRDKAKPVWPLERHWLWAEPIKDILTGRWTQETVGVSFVSIFILIYHILFWVCGFARSLAWDYAPGVPQGEAAERRLHWKEKPIGGFVHKHIWRNPPTHKITEKDPQRKESSVPPVEDKKSGIQENMQDIEGGRVASPALPESQSIQRISNGAHEYAHQRPGASDSDGAPDPSAWKRLFKTVAMIFTPINSAIAASLVVALVKPLKALFVDTSGVGGPSWAGPDGNPPLSFIIDTGSQQNTLW
jgi:predicted permease